MDTTSAPPPTRFERFNKLLAEYGVLFLVIHYVIFGLVITGFATAIELGVRTDSMAASVGTWSAAYLAAKLTTPVRLAITVAITPPLAKLLRRFRIQRPRAEG